jgi:cell division protein FtsA
MARRRPELLTGIEIGTHTVKVAMGEFGPDDTLRVLSKGEARVGLHETMPTGGDRKFSPKVMKATILDTRFVTDQVVQAVRMAHDQARCESENVFLAVTGGHVETNTTVGTTPINGPGRRVTEEDVLTANRNAQGYPLPPEKLLINTMDRRYLLDQTREVPTPIGQVGNRLEAEFHLVYGDRNTIFTACEVVTEVMGFPVNDICFSPIAASYAALTNEDREVGSLLIDVGAGITEFALIQGPGCFHSGQLTVGCNQVVNDLAIAFDLPMRRCQEILHRLGEHGSAVMKPDGRARKLTLDTPRGEVTIPVSSAEQVIEMRLKELLQCVRQQIQDRGGLDRMGRGVVLCGGGARIPGIDQLARRVFDVPVRIGKAAVAGGPESVINSPDFMVPVGLLIWGHVSLEIGRQEPSFTQQLGREFGRAWRAVGRALRF